MFDSFLTFINQFKPALTHRPTLLAVSGGIDSVAMMNLFHKAGLNAGVAHCNFGLRGQDSDDDELFVRQLAEGYGFQFFTAKFNTKVYCRTHSVSTQMAARELRYPWFEQIREQNGYEWIATAHHLNDSVETALLNLTRGTGIAGLKGILPVNNHLVRPLLFATRSQIEEYVKTEALEWREDSSNSSLGYRRNLIRHKVIPVLKEINPSLENTFVQTSHKVTAANNLVEIYLKEWAERIVIKEGEGISVLIDSILTAPEPEYRLWFIVASFGFGYDQSLQVYESLNNGSGRVFYSEKYRLLIDRNKIIVRKIKETEHGETIIENLGSFQVGGGSLVLISTTNIPDFKNVEKCSAFFDEDLITFPLSIRKWKLGDKMAPFGMKGKQKKISDILVDLKFDRFQKEDVKVLVNGDGEIIWLVGLRTSEIFKVGSQTTSVIEGKFLEDAIL